MSSTSSLAINTPEGWSFSNAASKANYWETQNPTFATGFDDGQYSGYVSYRNLLAFAGISVRELGGGKIEVTKHLGPLTFYDVILPIAGYSIWPTLYTYAVEGTINNDTMVITSYNSAMFRGFEGNDALTGGAGDDLLVGGLGFDEITGGAGNDTADFGDLPYGVTANMSELEDNGFGQLYFFAQAGDYSSNWEVDTLTQIENLRGTRFNDSFVGDANNNVLIGLDGNDVLMGADGNDTLDAGRGHDVIFGGAGMDLLDYYVEWQATGIVLNIDMNALTDGFFRAYDTAHNEFDDVYDVEHIRAAEGSDSLIGNGQANFLYGMGGNDSIDGNAGDDILDGGDGMDVLFGGDGDDFIVQDVILQAQSWDRIDGGAGTDTVEFVAPSRKFNGGDYSYSVSVSLRDSLLFTNIENVIGTPGNDTLIGDAGDNVLRGRDGYNVLDGGDGIDTADYSDIVWKGHHAWPAGPSVEARLELGQVIHIWYDNAGVIYTEVDTLSNIENIVGSVDSDSIWGDSADNRFEGGDGADLLSGSNGDDWLVGGAGNDTLDGGTGSDTADFSDAALGDGNGIQVLMQSGLVNTGRYANGVNQANRFDTIAGIENIVGTRNADALWGDGQSNRFEGGDGADLLASGDGNDWLVGGAGNDALDGGTGSDTADFSDAALGDGNGIQVLMQSGRVNTGRYANGVNQANLFDTITGIENIVGTRNADAIWGDGQSNRFEGGDGADLLASGDGNDWLVGGAGNDALDGGTGIDTADFSDAALGDGNGIQVLMKSGLVNTGRYANGVNQANRFDTIAGIENIVGTRNADAFWGDGQGNRFEGRDGTDLLNGGDGNDWLAGGAGNDVLDGGTGSDTADFSDAALGDGNGIQVLMQSGLVNTGRYANGVNQANLFDTIAGIENIVGTRNADAFWGDEQNNRFEGGDGTDLLNGGDGNDVLIGGAGNDTLSDATAKLAGAAARGRYIRIYHTDLTNTLSLTELQVWANGVNVAAGKASRVGTDGTGTFSAFANSPTALTDGLSLGAAWNGQTGGASNLAWVMRTGWGYPEMPYIELDLSAVYDIDQIRVYRRGEAGDLAQAQNLRVMVSQAPMSGSYVDLVDNPAVAHVDSVGPTASVAFADIDMHAVQTDAFDGGEGVDTLDYSTSVVTQRAAQRRGVHVNLATGHANKWYSEGSPILVLDTIAGIENLTGTAQNDILIGDAQANVFIGGAGNDTLDGGAGSDTADFSDAALGDGNGIHALLSQGIVYTDLYVDTITGIENIVGTRNADAFWGDGQDNRFEGGDGTDLLSGSNGDDWLVGGAGNDTLDGGTGSDTADFSDAALGDGNGIQVLMQSGLVNTGRYANGVNQANRFDTIAGIENIVGTRNADALWGDGQSNRFEGGDGADLLSAGDGDDWLVGGAGNDALDGGTGIDTADFSDAALGDGNGIQVLLSQGIVNTGLYANGAIESNRYDTITGIETIVGTRNADAFWGDEQNNRFEGGDGTDLLNGGDGNDVLIGGAGNDTLSDATATLAGAATRGRYIRIYHTDRTDILSLTELEVLANGVNVAAGMTSSVGIDGNGTFSDRDNSPTALTDGLSLGAAWNGESGAASNLAWVMRTGWYPYPAERQYIELDLGAVHDIDQIKVYGRDEDAVYRSFLYQSQNLRVMLSQAPLSGSYLDLANDPAVLYVDSIGPTGLTTVADIDMQAVQADSFDGGEGVDTLDYAGSVVTRLVTQRASQHRGVHVNLATGYANKWYSEGSPVAVLDTIAGIENLTGTAQGDILIGDAQANVFNAGAGNDRLEGGAGNDRLEGGLGDDRYEFAAGSGGDTVADSAGSDTMAFAASSTQLWFQRSYRDLIITVIGTADQVRVANWYVSGHREKVTLQAGGDGKQLAGGDGKQYMSAQVDALVEAMASLAPPPMGQTTLSDSYLSQLAPVLAAWSGS